MSVPTQAEMYSKLRYHITEAQSCAAMLSHLANANDDGHLARKWLAVEELLKQFGHKIMLLAQGRLN